MIPNDRIIQLLKEYPAGARAYRGWEPKPNGKLRPITKPNRVLRVWLQAMNAALDARFNTWPDFMHGGIKSHSHVSYARPHVGKACVITVDIRHCFDTIKTRQVAAVLQQKLGLDKPVADELAKRLCFRDKVAQGFPTSNFVCNLYLLQSLTELAAAFRGQGFGFTNYVDDVAVSGNITQPAAVIDQIAHSLSQIGLAISKGKIRVMPSTHKQVICGLLVNRRLTLTATKKLELFSAVARHTMSKASAQGWVSNLHNVDPGFSAKFQTYARKKGLL
jgi:RNA-directed DNA polymerase